MQNLRKTKQNLGKPKRNQATSRENQAKPSKTKTEQSWRPGAAYCLGRCGLLPGQVQILLPRQKCPEQVRAYCPDVNAPEPRCELYCPSGNANLPRRCETYWGGFINKNLRLLSAFAVRVRCLDSERYADPLASAQRLRQWEISHCIAKCETGGQIPGNQNT